MKSEEEERPRKEEREEEIRKEQERGRREEEEQLRVIAKGKQEAVEKHRWEEERQERARTRRREGRKEEERFAEEANRRKWDEKEEEERRRKKEEWRQDVQLKEEDLRKANARQRTNAQEKTAVEAVLHHTSHDRTDTARWSEDEVDSDIGPEPNSHIPIPTSPIAEHSPLNKTDHSHHRRALHPATVPLPSPPKHAPAARLNQETRNRSQSAQPRSTRIKEAGRRKEENSQDRKSGTSTPLTTTVTHFTSVCHSSIVSSLICAAPLTANALASRQRKEEQKRIAEAAEQARERVRRKKQEEQAERKAVEEAQRREKEKMNSQIQLQQRIVEKNIDTIRRVEQIGEERTKGCGGSQWIGINE
ncbi:hypothetical protein BLNAU_19270 [Blattamonas nauphoetae]|uniref:Ensconsin-like n=1 Tax=Blattamonas nauphoetae TaxID=2049346 RepID=A0ABQ9X1X9_9EUKA|nr:hypothetical protein BLNAU_19270 [Blattamonas nauphoetae]